MDFNYYCSFCAELSGSDYKNYFHDLFGDELHSRVIFNNNSWIVCPTIGCFLEGYVLLITKEHKESLYLCTKSELEELCSLIVQLEKVFDTVYQSGYILFEHGKFEDSLSSCCEDHLHVHMLPYRRNIINLIEQYPFDILPIDSIYELNEVIEKIKKPYVFFKDFDLKKYVFYSSSNIIPSQFMRQLICKDVDMSDCWDWRKYVFKCNIIRTINKLIPFQGDVQHEIKE